MGNAEQMAYTGSLPVLGNANDVNFGHGWDALNPFNPQYGIMGIAGDIAIGAIDEIFGNMMTSNDMLGLLGPLGTLTQLGQTNVDVWSAAFNNTISSR